jgi:hypothetical protein
LLVLLASMAGIYGVATSEVFAVTRTEIEGATWTPEQEILGALSVPSGQNAFAIDTAALEARLLAIPAVRGAVVTVALPDAVHVAVTERVALMAWQVGEHRYLVDASGRLFGELTSTGQAGAGLPVIDDQRAASGALGVGSTLDAVTLDAALRLGSLAPGDVDGTASGLDLRVDDTDGFVMRGRPANWTAVFGFYTPTLRTTELIPGQVRLLHGVLLGREASTLRVILADDRSGTRVPRPTTRPSAKPSPTTAP